MNNKRMIYVAMLFSLFILVFNLTLPLMSGIYIVSNLGGSPFTVIYGVSFFCIGNVMTLPLGKPGLLPITEKRYYCLYLSLMAFTSLGCATANSFFMFVTYRFIEGLVSGPLYLLLTGHLIPVFAPKKENYPLLPIMLTTFAITPVIGACFGGWIAYLYHWRILFYVNFIIFVLLIFFMMSQKVKKAPSLHQQVDWLGLFFFATAVFGLGSVLTTGQELDWYNSPTITHLSIMSLISFILFFFHSRQSQFPIVNFSLFLNPFFCYWLANIILIFSAYFAMVILFSLWLKIYVSYTPNWIALLLLAMAAGAWIPMFLNYQRYDPRKPLAVALVFFVISSWYTSGFNEEVNFARIGISRLIAGLGLSIFLPPLFRLTINANGPEYNNDSAILFHMARLFASGVGAALYTIMWHRRQVFYHERLAEGLSIGSPATDTFFYHAQQVNLQGQHALAKLNQLLTTQATALALTDCFYFMFWVMVILLVLLLSSFLIRSKIEFH